jgi:polysaccharide deacetylase 2 family uncharacterized protein YibQ
VAVARKKTRRRRTSHPGRFVLLILILAGLVFGASRLLLDERGQALLVGWGVTDRFLPRLELQLDVALAECFLELGLSRRDVEPERTSDDGVDLRTYRLVAPPHLTPTQCNQHITRAATQMGARVLRAEELHDHQGAVIVQFGFGSRLTHRIVIRPQRELPPLAKGQRKPRVALVIDDLGHNLDRRTREIFEWDIPLTVAVLPELPASKASFDAARAAGIPALLHLPMESNHERDPGRSPVMVGMQPVEIEALIVRYTRQYGAFPGVNNHMGSRATEDRETMDALADVLARHDLYFFDSMTSPESVAHEAVQARGVWSTRNDLFLDHRTHSMADVAETTMELADLARKAGLAIGIAHARPYTLQALRAMLPRLAAEGIEFVTLEDLRQPQDGRSAGRRQK